MRKLHYLVPVALVLTSILSCDRRSAPPLEADGDPNATLNLQREIEREMLALELERLAADRDAALADAAYAREAVGRAKTEQALAEAQARAAEAEQALAEARAQEAGAREKDLPPRAHPSAPHESDYTSTPDYSLFYRELEPHGAWFETAEYGYVWQPEAAQRFPQWRPYTNGRWLDTDRGWAWWSEEPFGWATYHYGRWTEIARVGWIWVPGPDWAPAWVSWRVGENHIGWAPLPPVTVYETTFNYGARTDSACGISPHHYNFVPTRFFVEPVHSHTLPPAQNLTVIEHTTNVTNIHVHKESIMVEGPSPERLRREFGPRIPRHNLSRHDWDARPRNQRKHAPDPGGGRVDFIAPRISRASAETAKPSLLAGIIEQARPARSASRPDANLIQNFVRSRARQSLPNEPRAETINSQRPSQERPDATAPPEKKTAERERSTTPPTPERSRPGAAEGQHGAPPQRPGRNQENRGPKGSPSAPQPQPQAPSAPAEPERERPTMPPTPERSRPGAAEGQPGAPPQRPGRNQENRGPKSAPPAPQPQPQTPPAPAESERGRPTMPPTPERSRPGAAEGQPGAPPQRPGRNQENRGPKGAPPAPQPQPQASSARTRPEREKSTTPLSPERSRPGAAERQPGAPPQRPGRNQENRGPKGAPPAPQPQPQAPAQTEPVTVENPPSPVMPEVPPAPESAPKLEPSVESTPAPPPEAEATPES